MQTDIFAKQRFFAAALKPCDPKIPKLFPSPRWPKIISGTEKYLVKKEQ